MSNFSQTVFNWLGLGRYNATLPTITTGSTGEMQLNQRGLLRVVTATEDAGMLSWNDPDASGYDIRKLVKAMPGRMVCCYGANEDTFTMWLMLFDAIDLPGNGLKPWWQVRLDAGQSVQFVPARPRACPLGIAWAASTTSGTLTLPNDAKFCVTIGYE